MEHPKIEYTCDFLAKAEEWCWRAFKVYQAAQDDADILHDSAKDLLASLMSRIDKPEEKNSEAKLERLARDSEEWRKFKMGEHAAIQKAGESKVKYYSAVRMWDSTVNGISYRKAELTKLGA